MDISSMGDGVVCADVLLSTEYTHTQTLERYPLRHTNNIININNNNNQNLLNNNTNNLLNNNNNISVEVNKNSLSVSYNRYHYAHTHSLVTDVVIIDWDTGYIFLFI